MSYNRNSLKSVSSFLTQSSSRMSRNPSKGIAQRRNLSLTPTTKNVRKKEEKYDEIMSSASEVIKDLEVPDSTRAKINSSFDSAYKIGKILLSNSCSTQQRTNFFNKWKLFVKETNNILSMKDDVMASQFFDSEIEEIKKQAKLLRTPKQREIIQAIISNLEIELEKYYKDEEATELISHQINTMNKNIDDFEENNREDVIYQFRNHLTHISEFLLPKSSPEQNKATISKCTSLLHELFDPKPKSSDTIEPIAKPIKKQAAPAARKSISRIPVSSSSQDSSPMTPHSKGSDQSSHKAKSKLPVRAKPDLMRRQSVSTQEEMTRLIKQNNSLKEQLDSLETKENELNNKIASASPKPEPKSKINFYHNEIRRYYQDYKREMTNLSTDAKMIHADLETKIKKNYSSQTAQFNNSRMRSSIKSFNHSYENAYEELQYLLQQQLNLVQLPDDPDENDYLCAIHAYQADTTMLVEQNEDLLEYMERLKSFKESNTKQNDSFYEFEIQKLRDELQALNQSRAIAQEELIEQKNKMPPRIQLIDRNKFDQLHQIIEKKWRLQDEYYKLKDRLEKSSFPLTNESEINGELNDLAAEYNELDELIPGDPPVYEELYNTTIELNKLRKHYARVRDRGAFIQKNLISCVSDSKFAEIQMRYLKSIGIKYNFDEEMISHINDTFKEQEKLKMQLSKIDNWIEENFPDYIKKYPTLSTLERVRLIQSDFN